MYEVVVMVVPATSIGRPSHASTFAGPVGTPLVLMPTMYESGGGPPPSAPASPPSAAASAPDSCAASPTGCDPVSVAASIAPSTLASVVPGAPLPSPCDEEHAASDSARATPRTPGTRAGLTEEA